MAKALAIGPDEAKRQVAEKLTKYRAAAMTGDDAVFDAERRLFLIHGKHPLLANVDAVIAVDLASMLMAVSQVIQTTIVPMLVQRPQDRPQVSS